MIPTPLTSEVMTNVSCRKESDDCETSRRNDEESGLMYFRARYYDPNTGEFISRDPLEYVDGMSLYRGYFVPDATDPTGKVCIKCLCQGDPGLEGFDGDPDYWASTECKGLARNCCQKACPFGFKRSWRICSAIPDTKPPIEDSCPDNWWGGTDYLTCTACCIKSYKFWTSIEAVTACGGLRVPKYNPKPGQTPTTSVLNRARRCIPRRCRPTLNTTRACGKRLGYLFIAEGCYDFGVSATCASYCAAR